MSLFGSELVVAGDASRERGRFPNRLSELRKQADYGYEPLDVDVDALLSEARAFVAEMEDTVVGEERWSSDPRSTNWRSVRDVLGLDHVAGA